jgi:hypothetical protein
MVSAAIARFSGESCVFGRVFFMMFFMGFYPFRDCLVSICGPIGVFIGNEHPF